MKKSQVYSEDLRRWHSAHIQALLVSIRELKEPAYTHYFGFIGISSFAGPLNRPHLRKCLRTLEAYGLIENINLGFHIHQWKITEKGITNDFKATEPLITT
jgi:hypothetical protein